MRLNSLGADNKWQFFFKTDLLKKVKIKPNGGFIMQSVLEGRGKLTLALPVTRHWITYVSALFAIA
ncbi:MAG TPA: hypothetical protein DEF05_13855 [Erwinia sp.]|uniref:hypothetical protein n=1 Tax=Erwinia citreus TaxID=558 RepID=UPI000E847BA4|nr:hypothetical protein [Erwinia sp.]HBV40730.1 hypothetical protein [Erwinia sp.]